MWAFYRCKIILMCCVFMKGYICFSNLFPKSQYGPFFLILLYSIIAFFEVFEYIL